MKKYVIVEKKNDSNTLYWSAYRYTLGFRLTGKLSPFNFITCSYESIDNCRTKLKNELNNKGKFTVIEILEI